MASEAISDLDSEEQKALYIVVLPGLDLHKTLFENLDQMCFIILLKKIS